MDASQPILDALRHKAEHPGMDFAIFVPAFLCGHRSDDPLREVEVGSRASLAEAVHRALEFGTARVVEAWQGGDGAYHYGLVVHEHGRYLLPWRLPVESIGPGAHARG